MEKDLSSSFDSIPKQYLSPTFDINNPKCFAEIADSEPGMLLQEKLTYYLDIVEVCLFKQINACSKSFFSALSLIQDLYLEAQLVTNSVSIVRKDTKVLHNSLVKSGLKVLSNFKRRKKLEEIVNILEMIHNVAEGPIEINQRLNRLIDEDIKDYSYILDLITNTQNTIQKDLDGVICVSNLIPQIDRFNIKIGEYMSNQMVDRIILIITNQEKEKKKTNNQMTEMSDITPLLQGLSRVNQLNLMLPTLRSTLTELIKNLIRQHVSDQLEIFKIQIKDKIIDNDNIINSKNDNNNNEKENQHLTDNIKNLSSSNFLSLLRSLFTVLLPLLKRLRSIDLLSYLTTFVSNTSKGPIDNFKIDYDDIFLNSCDLALSGIITLIKFKGQSFDNTNREYEDLLKEKSYLKSIINETMTFSKTIDSLLGTPIISLPMALLDLTKIFLESLHSSIIKSLIITMETDKWIEVKCDDELRNLIFTKFAPQIQVQTETITTDLIKQFNLKRNWDDDETNLTDNISLEKNKNKNDEITIKKNDKDDENQISLEKNKNDENDENVKNDEIILKKRNNDDESNNNVIDVEKIKENKNKIDNIDNNNSINPNPIYPLKTSFSLPTLSLSPSLQLTIGQNHFPLVQPIISLLKFTPIYIQCAIDFPGTASDVLLKFINLLSIFNSKTNNLLLGAAAVKLQDKVLKRITATHLSLLSQSLGLIITLIPYFHNVFLPLIPKKQHEKLVELSNLMAIYDLHRSSIFEKLIKIIDDLIKISMDKYIHEMNNISKDKELVIDVSEHFIKLMKQTSTLHRILSSYLTTLQRNQIFEKVGHSFSHHFARLDTVYNSYLLGKSPIPKSKKSLKHSKHENNNVDQQLRSSIVQSSISASVQYVIATLDSLQVSTLECKKNLEKFL